MFFIKGVSVPLRGKYRGEAEAGGLSGAIGNKFPSPCGVNIVAKRDVDKRFARKYKVSVPLRGKYRGEDQLLEDAGLAGDYQVSVPLRGKYRGEAHLVIVRSQQS